MKGQISVEFFFAAIMAFLAVYWLLNYINLVRDTGTGIAVRQEQLVAAEIASVVNQVCISNISVTLQAPCVITVNQSMLYTINSTNPVSNKISVSSPDVEGVWNATTICPVRANMTATSATGLRWVYLSCNIQNSTYTQRLCVFRHDSNTTGIRIGAC